MIPRVRWEVYLGDEEAGFFVGVEESMPAAVRLAEEGLKATGKIHAVVKVTRTVEGVVKFPDPDTHD